MRNDTNIAQQIANATVFYELISLFENIAKNAVDLNEKIAATMVKEELEEIQFLPKKLNQLANTNPVIPGVTTPIDFTEFPGLSEKAFELAQKLVQDRRNPAVLSRHVGQHKIEQENAQLEKHNRFKFR